MVASAPTVSFDPFDPVVLADPYEAYAEVRDAGPAVHVPAHDLWAIGRYDDVRAALRDFERFTSAGDEPPLPGGPHATTGRVIRSDPPDHTRARRAVAPLFTERALAQQERRLRMRVADALDGLVGAGPVDVIDALATPIAVGTFADLLCRVDLEEGEAWSVLAGLSAAGMDTTAEVLGNTLHLLATHPEAWAALRSCPRLAEAACEEVLRHESPVQQVARTATEEVDLGGVAIPAGARVLLLPGSADRDPRHYDDADAFAVRRFERRPADHVAFGHGVHLCLGAPLARLEGRVVVEELVARAAAVEPAGEPERPATPGGRRLRALPLVIHGR
jgi:cytochrome P450